MTTAEYTKQSARTDLTFEQYLIKANAFGERQEVEDLLQFMHAALGMAGETGEVVELVKKQFMYGKEFSREDMIKECGDVLWYMAIILRTLNSSFDEVMQANIDKLAKRFPEKFSEQAAIERKDEA